MLYDSCNISPPRPPVKGRGGAGRPSGGDGAPLETPSFHLPNDPPSGKARLPFGTVMRNQTRVSGPTIGAESNTCERRPVLKNIEERRNRTIAREANYHASMRAPHIDKTAISPYDDYCDGYGMPGAYGNGYVSVLKVSAGTVEKTNDALIDTIVTYDKAETADAYIGQINMLTASSFCGMAGQVWGYDLARHDDITSGKASRCSPRSSSTAPSSRCSTPPAAERRRRSCSAPRTTVATIPSPARTPSAPTRASPPTARRRTARSRPARPTASGRSSPSRCPPTATSLPTWSSRTPAYGPKTTTRTT